MKIDEWCQLHDITKAGYYWRLRKVREAYLKTANHTQTFVDVPSSAVHPVNVASEHKIAAVIRTGNNLTLENIVSSIYNDDRGTGLFLDLVSYYLTTENNAGQYYPDYAYNHPLFTPGYKIYSDSTVSEFIGQISVHDSVEFQNEWNALKKNKDKTYISYDSTSKNCQAGDIELVEYSHVKEDKGLPVFNYSIAYDCNNREPLSYEDYPRSIVDVSQLQCMLDKAKAYGYKNAGFILDRGYFSAVYGARRSPFRFRTAAFRSKTAIHFS